MYLNSPTHWFHFLYISYWRAFIQYFSYTLSTAYLVLAPIHFKRLPRSGHLTKITHPLTIQIFTTNLHSDLLERIRWLHREVHRLSHGHRFLFPHGRQLQERIGRRFAGVHIKTGVNVGLFELVVAAAVVTGLEGVRINGKNRTASRKTVEVRWMDRRFAEKSLTKQLLVRYWYMLMRWSAVKNRFSEDSKINYEKYERLEEERIW